jgi:hypothetical protein
MLRWFFRFFTHGLALAIGFAAGIYVLPILTAAPGPTQADIDRVSAAELFRGTFDRKLAGSDFFHWGDGEILVSATQVLHVGSLAPGPDYRLYLVPDFVDSKEAFLKVKDQAVRLGEIRSFSGFVVDVPPDVDVANYTTAVVWCETFGSFITAAKYR